MKKIDSSLTIRIPKDLKRKLEKLAVRSRISTGRYLRRVIQNHINEMK